MGKYLYIATGIILISIGWILAILTINYCLDNPCTYEKAYALKDVALNPFPIFLMIGSLLLGAGIYYNHGYVKVKQWTLERSGDTLCSKWQKLGEVCGLKENESIINFWFVWVFFLIGIMAFYAIITNFKVLEIIFWSWFMLFGISGAILCLMVFLDMNGEKIPCAKLQERMK